jgi:hypothetical protein
MGAFYSAGKNGKKIFWRREYQEDFPVYSSVRVGPPPTARDV